MVTPKTNTQFSAVTPADSKSECKQIVGHLPKEIAKICFYFIVDRGIITGEVTDKCRRTKEVCGEMEVPCLLKFKHTRQTKIDKTVQEIRKVYHGD